MRKVEGEATFPEAGARGWEMGYEFVEVVGESSRVCLNWYWYRSTIILYKKQELERFKIKIRVKIELEDMTLKKRTIFSVFLISLALLLAFVAVPVSAVNTDMTETFNFPTVDDTWNIANDPFMYLEGDYVEGTRDLGFFALLFGIDIHLELDYNGLTGDGYIDIDVYVDDKLVGSFTVMPGDTTKDVSFFFIKFVRGGLVKLTYFETNNVVSMGGAIIIDDTMSTVTFKGFWF